MTRRAQFVAGGLLSTQSAVVLAQVETTTCTASAGNILSGLGSESAFDAAVSELAAARTPMQQNLRK
jgi:hypothetical protein